MPNSGNGRQTAVTDSDREQSGQTAADRQTGLTGTDRDQTVETVGRPSPNGGNGRRCDTTRVTGTERPRANGRNGHRPRPNGANGWLPANGANGDWVVPKRSKRWPANCKRE
jgi:hypothetical protein